MFAMNWDPENNPSLGASVGVRPVFPPAKADRVNCRVGFECLCRASRKGGQTRSCACTPLWLGRMVQPTAGCDMSIKLKLILIHEHRCRWRECFVSLVPLHALAAAHLQPKLCSQLQQQAACIQAKHQQHQQQPQESPHCHYGRSSRRDTDPGV